MKKITIFCILFVLCFSGTTNNVTEVDMNNIINVRLYTYTIEKLKQIEHYQPLPYKLGRHYYVGYGHKLHNELAQYIDKRQANRILHNDFNIHYKMMLQLKHYDTLAYCKRLAITSFIMSIGITKYRHSIVYKLIKAGKNPTNAILHYTKYDGKHSKTLKQRRIFESKLYNNII